MLSVVKRAEKCVETFIKYTYVLYRFHVRKIDRISTVFFMQNK